MDFSLWSAPLGAAFNIGDNGVSGATRWSVPDLYTGGDIEPVPLPDGSVLYSSYANTGKGTVVTVLGLQTSPTSPMKALTTPQQDCGAPSVAADGVTVAMVCTNSGQTADLGGRDARGQRTRPVASARRELPLQLAVVVVERRTPSLHECVRPGRQLRALVHRQREWRSSARASPGQRFQRRPRRDFGRRVVEP